MKKIYLVGIKGVGMAALAVYLKEKGCHVIGSDVDEVFPTDKILKQHQIKVLSGFKKENLDQDFDLVITTAAHQGLSNIEVIAAKQHNIPVITYAEYLGKICTDHKQVIAVCGSHGKTTTAGLLAYIFHEAGLASSHIIGAASFSGLSGGHYGGDDYLIVEADEYVASPGIDNTPKFIYLKPDYIICTNLDWDHPDVYKDLAEVKTAFSKFFSQAIDENHVKIIYNKQDNNLLAITEPLSKENLIGFEPDDLRVDLISKITDILDLKIDNLNKLIDQFTGVNRRFEQIYQQNGVYLYDDYAHHPKEIDFLINKAKNQYPDKKLILIFKSHTYSRTAALEDEFISSLSVADKVYLLDIFASARENSADFKITSQAMAQKAKSQGFENIIYVSNDQMLRLVSEDINKGDCVIITVGAGDVYKYHKSIIKIIELV